MRKIWPIVRCSLLLAGLSTSSPAAVTARWDSLAPGLELGSFRGPWDTVGGDSTVYVLRIDPVAWELKILCAAELGIPSNLTAREWCERYGLAAATNAGMFAEDLKTHVGYLKSGEYLNSGRWNIYQSVLAFSPKDAAGPPARILDLDQTPREEILGGYHSLAQNLRLIKRPRKNQWTEQPQRWSEAALGEDGAGRILFIFSRSPFSMHAFNEILLSLPIDIMCAQHLEGGPEAQLFVQTGATRREFYGSYETDFRTDDDNALAWPIPNVLGIVPRSAGTGR